MKNLTVFFFTLLLLMGSANSLLAQGEYEFGRFYEGYLIMPDGAQIDGYIMYENFNKMQSSIIYATDPNNRRTRMTYKAKDLAAFKVADKLWHSIPFKDLIGPKQQMFMQLEQDGFIKLYLYYGTESNLRDDAQVIIKKGDEIAFNQGTFITGFHKKMSELVSEYEALASKVSNKEDGYKLLQLYDILEEFNRWYAENH